MAAIAANGIRINYRTSGRDGAPWITFSNSLATNISLWDDQVALLEGEFRILCYDQRGHGATEATDAPYSFDGLVADVISLWDALGIERSHFVGLSMGGTTGLGIAIDHGERLASLIACDCRCDGDAAFRAAWEPRIQLAREEGMAALAPLTTGRWFTEGFQASRPDVIERVNEMIRTTSVAGFIGCANALQTVDYRAGLGDIKVPTLFISGAQDPAATPDYIKTMTAQMAGVGHVVVDPAGHISNLEAPDQFDRAMVDFLTAQEA